MALQSFPNNMGIMIASDNNLLTLTSFTAGVLDAAGESKTYIGKVFLEAGSGSKVLSGAGGGRIRWRTSTVTFADAGSTLRVGVQDVASGVEDGTFDVYADLVGGTDTISGSADQITGMETGTKTIAHGDLIAVSIELVSKGGSDVVQVASMSAGLTPRTGNVNFPFITLDTGAGPVRSGASVIGCAIEFDDGTLGWIEPGILPPSATVNNTFNNTNTPDEYAAVFEIPFKCRISGGYFHIGAVATTDTFEIILYSDPEGTPTVVETITWDPLHTGSASNVAPFYFKFATARVLSINTKYAIAVRPTSANSITITSNNFDSGYEKYKNVFPFGSNLELMARTNQTGAFSVVQVYHMPYFGLVVDQLDDGVSTGGAESGFIVT